MVTLTLKINERSNVGKSLMSFLQSISKESKSVEVVEEKSPYNPEFVKRIKKAQKSGKYKVVNPNNLWESIS